MTLEQIFYVSVSVARPLRRSQDRGTLGRTQQRARESS
jgi:hypothetical protein